MVAGNNIRHCSGFHIGTFKSSVLEIAPEHLKEKAL